MTEIEKTEGEIKVLQAKLELLKEMEKHKSPAEEAFKRVYCRYPDKLDDKYGSAWDIFEKGYARAQKDYKVGEYEPTPQGPQGPVGPGPGPKGVIVGYEPTSQETQMTLEKSGEFSIVSYNGETYYRNLYDGICGGWYKTDTDGEVFYLVEDETERKVEKLYQEQVVVKEPEKEQKWGDIVRESVKWCKEHPDESVEDYLTPQTPDKIEENLREAFQKVQQTEEWKETQRKIDSNYDEMVKNPPEFLKFELGKTLEALITRWWDDVLYGGIHQDWDREVAIDDLIDQIQLWLPREQSHEGTQSASVIDLVDGYNDALTKIKSKLRNKKDT